MIKMMMTITRIQYIQSVLIVAVVDEGLEYNVDVVAGLVLEG